jgi:hypothetical protein
MNKCITVIALVVFIFLKNTSIAQDNLTTIEANDSKKDMRTFNIISLDDKNKKIMITPDYVNKVLRINCLKDTINIDNYWGVPPEIKILNKNFIEIKYEVRGGSNLGLGNMLILCVNGNLLYEAIHVLRYSNWQSYDKRDYLIKLFLTGNSKSNYKLNVHIHDDAYSKSNPETNYNYSNQTVLNFDTAKNVFYSLKEGIYNQNIAIKSNESTKQKINGNFPVIIFGKETYYFLNNRWYQLGTDNVMHEFE